MKLKDFDDSKIFTWWTLVDQYENVLGNMNGKCGEVYEKYKDTYVLKIYGIDIDLNWENNYVTVMLDIDNQVEGIPF